MTPVASHRSAFRLLPDTRPGKPAKARLSSISSQRAACEYITCNSSAWSCAAASSFIFGGFVGSCTGIENHNDHEAPGFDCSLPCRPWKRPASVELQKQRKGQTNEGQHIFVLLVATLPRQLLLYALIDLVHSPTLKSIA